MIVEIQCLPSPAGTPESPYCNIEAAIAVIQASGLRYEVGALGTTIEGEADEVWPLLRRVHEACLAAGANSAIAVIKLAEAAAGREGPSIAGLTSKFRS